MATGDPVAPRTVVSDRALFSREDLAPEDIEASADPFLLGNFSPPSVVHVDELAQRAADVAAVCGRDEGSSESGPQDDVEVSLIRPERLVSASG